MKVAWGITGSGDKIAETVGLMERLKEEYGIEIVPYASKEGEVVLKFYRLLKRVKEVFPGYKVERSANAPFLASKLQLGKFDLFLIAPATANTVAKIAHGIADTLLTNAALQAMKTRLPVYIYPVDQEVGDVTTILPNGREMRIHVREEDVKNVETLREMDGITVLKSLDEVEEIIRGRDI
ncbi:Flavoprotein [Candidatus Methanoperedenaceae archaeon GB50]|nr:Flavoprotein [Candidatus Methanoperedenaceae archaeon GB50]CAD7773068.1 MAG: Flavoprotein [Candidatus Methanoperedenaceae archaeon GB50]